MPMINKAKDTRTHTVIKIAHEKNNKKIRHTPSDLKLIFISSRID